MRRQQKKHSYIQRLCLCHLLCLLLGGLIATAGCGDDATTDGDAGLIEPNRLVVLAPPGESIGLSFSGEVELRVRYEDSSGRVLEGEDLSFRLLSTASENPGGSTLSKSESRTDSSGIATVVLRAGAQQVNFRVEVSAINATPALFYVAVSEVGFANLEIIPRHIGARRDDTFDSVELRLFGLADLRCSEISTRLDPSTLPDSVFPPRSVDNFGASAHFDSLNAAMPYTLVSWAPLASSGVAAASGCVELSQDQARPGSMLRILLPTRDHLLELSGEYEIATELSVELLLGSAASTAWTTLTCPLGSAQLLVDCLADLAADDGTADCIVDAPSALSSQLQAIRGPAGSGGCRGELAEDEGVSVDKLIFDAVVAGAAFPTGPESSALADKFAALSSDTIVISRFEQSFNSSARHSLLSAELGEQSVDLVNSDRFRVSAVDVGVTVRSDGVVEIGPHQFDLDLGNLVAELFELSLSPTDQSTLGASLLASVSDSPSMTSDCAAIDNIVCPRLGQSTGCLASECGNLATTLQAAFDAYQVALQTQAGIDLSLEGAAPILDDNDDLIADSLGALSSPQQSGAWSATFELLSGQRTQSIPFGAKD